MEDLTKMRQIVFLDILFALVTLPSCSTAQIGITPGPAVMLSFSKAAERASVIALASVTSAAVQGAPSELAGIKVRLWRVRAHLEHVIVGTVAGNEIDYYFYGIDPSALQNGTLERISPGKRVILFLRREGDTFRAVTDVYPSHIDFIRPGLPDIRRFSSSRATHKIAALLVDGIDSDEASSVFAENLPYNVRMSLWVAGFSFTYQLVERLLASEKQDVRDAACIISVDALFAGETCLANVERRRPELRSRCNAVRHQRDSLRRVLSSGEHPPLVDYAEGVDRRDHASVIEFYRLVSRSEDRAIAAKAEEGLIREMTVVPR